MQAALEQEIENKKSRLSTYRLLWAFFMVFIVLPGWVTSSTVEGVGFSDAVTLVGRQLMAYGVPGFIVVCVMYPATVIATILPGSSLVALLALYMVFGIAPYVTAIFCIIGFGCIAPPFYQEKKRAIDPVGYDEERSRIIKKAAFSSKPFSVFVVFILVSALIGDVIYGYNRNVVADDYTGQVYLYDPVKWKKTPIDATVKVSIIDPGKIYDSKPGVHFYSVRLEFDGKGTEILRKMGIDPRLFESAEYEGKEQYKNTVCSINASKSTKSSTGSAFAHTGGSPLEIHHYETDPPDTKEEVRCPKFIHFAISSFGNAELAIDKVDKNVFIYMPLERDSRFSWLQQLILSSRLSSNPQTVL